MMIDHEKQAGRLAMRRKKRLWWRWTLLLLAISFLIVVGVGLLSSSSLFERYRLQSHAEATREAHAAAVATSTAGLRMTEQAQAQATLSALTQLQASYNSITGMHPTLTDPMHDPAKNKWETGTGCAFKNGVYAVSIAQKSSFIPCLTKNTTFTNFAYQARLKIVKGDAGGIVFRATRTSSKSYLFNIGQDGSYSIYYYPGDASGTTRTISNGFSNLIATGLGQENLLAVVARKNVFDLYINKKYLTSFQDSNLIVGQIGIIANDNQNNTEVVCTQIQVWNL